MEIKQTIDIDCPDCGNDKGVVWSWNNNYYCNKCFRRTGSETEDALKDFGRAVSHTPIYKAFINQIYWINEKILTLSKKLK